jgi:hypothetical protein
MTRKKTKRPEVKEMTKDEFIKSMEGKKQSKTWIAFMKAIKDPGTIVDMRAVLK